MKNWLKDLPTTALVTVVFCALAFLSGIMFWVAQAADWNLDDTELGIWLGFVAAGCGVAWKWFDTKRYSWKPTVPAGKDAEDTPQERRSVPRDTAYVPPDNPDHKVEWQRDG